MQSLLYSKDDYIIAHDIMLNTHTHAYNSKGDELSVNHTLSIE